MSASVAVRDRSVSRPSTADLRVALVGPLPPPPGGMANQCEQLARLLPCEAISVQVVRTNAPYRPAWAGRMPLVRALVRLLPYLWSLWRSAGRADVMHVLANSGWAWHLFAAPAVWIGRLRNIPVIVNYRGGEAEAFMRTAPRHVPATLRMAKAIVAPSPFLQRVFRDLGFEPVTVPNFVDLDRFVPGLPRDFGSAPHLVVTRNLEAIYDVATAMRAFARIRERFPDARLSVAGIGPERASLETLAVELGIDDVVALPGRIDGEHMPALYASADCMLNPSRVDNMPNAILEAFASGVPVVSTNAGGIPDMVDDGRSALLVPVGDAEAMAQQAVHVLSDRALAASLRSHGLQAVERYAWPVIRERWLHLYREVTADRGVRA
jgi:glycosyltransferase involved in cell wall biosynthesis